VKVRRKLRSEKKQNMTPTADNSSNKLKRLGSNYTHMRALVFVVAFALMGTGLLLASHAATPSDPLLRPDAFAPTLPSGSTRLGSLSSATPLNFSVVLPPSHQAELDALIDAQHNPSSPQYQQWLAPGEFAQRFGPDPVKANAVVNWLRGRGFSNASIADGMVEVHTNVQLASKGLGVSFAQYKLPGGKQSFSADQAPLVPNSIAPNIDGIVGLTF